jgi:hypothetical protein
LGPPQVAFSRISLQWFDVEWRRVEVLGGIGSWPLGDVRGRFSVGSWFRRPATFGSSSRSAVCGSCRGARVTRQVSAHRWVSRRADPVEVPFQSRDARTFVGYHDLVIGIRVCRASLTGGAVVSSVAASALRLPSNGYCSSWVRRRENCAGSESSRVDSLRPTIGLRSVRSDQ